MGERIPTRASGAARRRAGFGLAALAGLLLAVGLARAEVAQQGNVRLAFDVRFSPQALPRDRPAPVSVSFSGRISAVNGAEPPRVRRLTIAVNRRGTIASRGLPTCRPGELQSVTTAEALARCRPALVGRGHFAAFIDFPTGGFPVRGPMVAFNGRSEGRPAILLHVNLSSPVQVTLVLVMRVSHPRRGEFGTVLSASVPTLAGHTGYLTGIGLTLDRRYRSGGRTRSFVSASCPAAAGFTVSAFTLAKGNFEFADGQHAKVSLMRTCSVASP